MRTTRAARPPKYRRFPDLIAALPEGRRSAIAAKAAAITATLTLETRLLRGRSQRTVARSLGIHHSHLSRVLAGERSVSVDLLVRLADATGMTTGDLLTELSSTKKARPKTRK